MILTILAVLVAFLGELFGTSWSDVSMLVAIGFVTLSLVWRRKQIF